MRRVFLLLIAVMLSLGLVSCDLDGDGEVSVRHIPVMMYHDLCAEGDPGSDWTVSAAKFRSDMEWLRDNGYATVTTEDLEKPKKLPEKPVMITFDDGYASNYYLAYPILKELGMKATVSIIVERIDSEKDGFMNWDMVRELRESGVFDIGSHTYNSHIQPDGEYGITAREGESQEDYVARVEEDIGMSVRRIEEELGAAPKFFAYPLGKTEEWADPILEKYFTVTVTTNEGVADIAHGLYKLPRKNVTERASIAERIE